MPVEEHQIHPSTQRGADHKPACYNKPRTRNPLIVKAGFRMIDEGNGHYTSEQLWKTIPDTGSLECRSDCAECVGCEHFDTSYVDRINKEGS
jgi:hypothetical protein